MNFKLNHSQVQALYALFTQIINLGERNISFHTKQARLCFLLMHGIYAKLHRLVLPSSGKPKPSYSLQLSEVDTIALFLFFQTYNVSEGHELAGLTLDAMSELIDKHYQ